MKFLQVIALIVLISYSSVYAAKNYNSAIINCYIRHLKEANELGDEIQELPSSIKVTNCEELIGNIKTDLVKETIKNIKRRMDIDGKEQCVRENLKHNKIIDATFKAVIYEILQESAGQKYETEVREANEKLENVIDDSVMYCLFKEDFGELFDELFTDDSEEEEEDLEADYCGRKLTIDNQLLDTSVYTLELNPKNINTENINCETKLKEVTKKIEDDVIKGMKEEGSQLDEKDIECRLNAFKSENTFSKMVAASFFSEVNTSAEQKEAEKKKFIVMMGKVTFKASDCE